MVKAKDDSPLPRLYGLDRTEGKDTAPPWQEAAPSNHDRVGVVCVPLVADVVEPTDLRAVDCHDPVALGGGEQATELRLPPQALLDTLIADSLVHREKRSPLPPLRTTVLDAQFDRMRENHQFAGRTEFTHPTGLRPAYFVAWRVARWLGSATATESGATLRIRLGLGRGFLEDSLPCRGGCARSGSASASEPFWPWRSKAAEPASRNARGRNQLPVSSGGRGTSRWSAVAESSGGRRLIVDSVRETTS